MHLTMKEKVSYGIGALGNNLVYALVSGFLMYYYNTVLGISATFIGLLFLFARLFDALNDPIMGILVAKTRTRFGKYRPWIMSGTIINAVVLYAMFAVPKGLAGNSLLIFVSVAYILWGVTYTLLDIPYWSMIPSITNSGKEREDISVVARSCAGLGNAIITIVTMILVPILGFGEERLGFQAFAAIIAVLFVFTAIITVVNVKERNDIKDKPATVKQMIRALITNDQVAIVITSIIIFNASLYLTQQLAIYFFKYDFGRAELFGVFGAVGGAAEIVSMMLFPLVRKKLGRMKLFTTAIMTTICGYGMLFLMSMMNIQNIILLCIPCAVIYTGFGWVTILTTIFLADTVDYGEYKSGHRNESVIFSMQTFVVKLASAFSGLLAGVGIDLIGLDVTTITQSTQTLMGLRILMTILPLIGICFAFVVFHKKYILTEEYLENINQERIASIHD